MIADCKEGARSSREGRSALGCSGPPLKRWLLIDQLPGRNELSSTSDSRSCGDLVRNIFFCVKDENSINRLYQLTWCVLFSLAGQM